MAFDPYDDDFYDRPYRPYDPVREQAIQAAEQKNRRLIADMKRQREQFAGLGTNKAKRRLNKLADTNPLAKAVRIALEIEDKSIQAKNSWGKYRDKIYRQKTQLIIDLRDVFVAQGWTYGVHKSDVPPTSHVAYFEIPGCEQVSFHFTLEKKHGEFPVYEAKWDGKVNSTIGKLEAVARQLLGTAPIPGQQAMALSETA